MVMCVLIVSFLPECIHEESDTLSRNLECHRLPWLFSYLYEKTTFGKGYVVLGGKQEIKYHFLCEIDGKIQSNFNGSNTFEPMKISSRQG